ncbi:hypothetical protein COBT_002918, partial [Conglomerata obtusa]
MREKNHIANSFTSSTRYDDQFKFDVKETGYILWCVVEFLYERTDKNTPAFCEDQNLINNEVCIDDGILIKDFEYSNNIRHTMI